jgi:hypothetical protein
MSKKTTQIFLFIWIFITHAMAQRVITIDQTLNGSATYNYEARDEINFLPNTIYEPSSTNSLTATINENQIVVADIVSSPSTVLNRPQLNTALSVGTTEGSAMVTDAGQATYSIPIFTSPGTNGLVPNLSIQYISQQHKGVLGLGWDIAGLSSITRTGRNQYFDGVSEGMTFNDNDRFLLDDVPPQNEIN